VMISVLDEDPDSGFKSNIFKFPGLV
jgi:hypothetical protein